MAQINNTYFGIILLISAFVLNSTDIDARKIDDNWQVVKEDKENNIIIYYRKLETGNTEFRGITYINSSLNSFVALIDDFDKMPEWAYRTEKVVKLRQISKQEAYVYTVHPMPWPFMPRDSVLLSHIDQNPQTLVVTIQGRAVPDYIPLNADYVRIRSGESFWQLTPKGENTIEVVFQGYGEPGGSLSESVFTSAIFRSLVRLYLWKLPYKTLKQMKEQIKNEKYRKKRYYFIQEPPQVKTHQVLSQNGG